MEHHDHEHAEFAHTHEHTHADGSGSYTHSHEHVHDHGHSHDHGADGEKTAALLQYMLDHNIHHASELSDLAGHLTGEARHQLLHAVESFDQANGYLSAALEQLRADKDHEAKE